MRSDTSERQDHRVTEESARQRVHPATGDATAASAEMVDAESAPHSRERRGNSDHDDRIAALEARITKLEALLRHWV